MLLFNRVKNEDGSPWFPDPSSNNVNSEYYLWYSYICFARHKGFKNWIFGYEAIPYDGDGHELFGFGPFSIQWSILSSYYRAYYGFWYFLKKKK